MEVCTSCHKILPLGSKACPEDGAASQSVQDLPPGTRVGVYRLDKLLGQGGMGSVYLSEHTVLKKRYAIKLLRPKYAAQPEVSARFLQEARAANAIDHDHVVKIYDFGQTADGGAYLVMELLEGQAFDRYLREQGPLPIALALALFRQITSALEAAHQKGVFHRDLKPENIFILPREEGVPLAKVLDFGVARVVGDMAIPGLTRAGMVVGTPQYISPEQLTGKPADARSDIYSLGIIFFQALTGGLPFVGPKLSDYAQQHIFDTPPMPRQKRPELSEAFEGLVLRMLRKEPERRPQAMREVEQELASLAGEASPPPTLTRPRRAPRPRWLSLGAPLVVLGLGLGAWLALRERPPSDPLQRAQYEAARGDRGPLTLLAKQRFAEALASPAPERRAEAIEALAATPLPEDGAALQRALQDPDLEVRLLAAKALSQRQDDEARAQLKAAYEAAGGGRPPLSPPQFSLAVERLRAGDLSIREDIAAELASAKLSPKLKFDAALALTRAGSGAGSELLSKAVLSPESNMGQALAAADALYGALPEADALLQQTAAGDAPAWREAAHSLAARGDKEARERLRRAVTHGEVEAALLLAQLRDAAARSQLVARLSAPGPARARVVLALGRVGDDADLVPLAGLLSDPDPSIQTAAARAILAITAHQEAP